MELTITLALVVGTVLVSLAAFNDRGLFEKLLFMPYAVQHQNQLFRFFSHGFVHGDTMHLLVNMFVHVVVRLQRRGALSHDHQDTG